MITKWNREAFLVTIMAVMILFALFFYGNRYLLDPIKEEADILTQTVENQEALIDAYPPTEELQTDYEDSYLATESYLPLGAQANEALITLEQVANQTNVSLFSVSRIADQQPIEGAPANFVKNTYEVQMESGAPENFRALVDQLMNEERVWNITAFTYDKAAENNYTGTFSFELAYYSQDPSSSEEPSDEMTDTEETTEETAS